MAVRIYDSGIQAYKDAETPKIQSGGVWSDTDGKHYNGSAWVEDWSAIPANYIFLNGKFNPRFGTFDLTIAGLQDNLGWMDAAYKIPGSIRSGCICAEANAGYVSGAMANQKINFSGYSRIYYTYKPVSGMPKNASNDPQVMFFLTNEIRDSAWQLNGQVATSGTYYVSMPSGAGTRDFMILALNGRYITLSEIYLQ